VPAAMSEWLRRGATAVAVSRVGVGVVAFAAPALVSRSWVGGAGGGPSGRVLGRALGGRDLALGLGALAALRLQSLRVASGRAMVRDAALSAAPVPVAGPASVPVRPDADPRTPETLETLEIPESAVAAVHGGASPLDPAPPWSSGPFGPAGAGPAAVWVGLAALADGLDLLTTARAWPELPPLQRWLVALSSGGAAAVGAAAAAVLLTGSASQPGTETMP
jgi:hypothetical protein